MLETCHFYLGLTLARGAGAAPGDVGEATSDENYDERKSANVKGDERRSGQADRKDSLERGAANTHQRGKNEREADRPEPPKDARHLARLAVVHIDRDEAGNDEKKSGQDPGPDAALLRAEVDGELDGTWNVSTWGRWWRRGVRGDVTERWSALPGSWSPGCLHSRVEVVSLGA